jgi:phosphatidylglycerophosphate synthase
MVTPRREIKTRDTKWAKSLATFIATKTNITPNDISVFSVFCGLIAFIGYCGYVCPQIPTRYYFILPIIAIIGIQLRLICNLIDGMVAVEGGKKSVVGDIYNEFPDRLSDTFIIVGAGIAGGTWLSVCLGLLAALLAMFTAYTRVLAGAIGATQKFLGPMAKQHRMALLTVVSFICVTELFYPNLHSYAYPAALVIIIIGTIITVWRRVSFAANELIEKSKS